MAEKLKYLSLFRSYRKHNQLQPDICVWLYYKLFVSIYPWKNKIEATTTAK